MKKILSLSGVQQLSKVEQQEIKGATWGSNLYCRQGKCCIVSASGAAFCDPGWNCSNGRCSL